MMRLNLLSRRCKSESEVNFRGILVSTKIGSALGGKTRGCNRAAAAHVQTLKRNQQKKKLSLTYVEELHRWQTTTL